MKKFEYLCVFLDEIDNRKYYGKVDGCDKVLFLSFTDALNTYGNDGWELVNVQRYTDEKNEYGLEFIYVWDLIFKREKQDE